MSRTKCVCVAVSVGVYTQWALDLSCKPSGTSVFVSLGSNLQRTGMIGTRVAGEQGQTHPQMCSNSALQHMARKGPRSASSQRLLPSLWEILFHLISRLFSQPTSHPPAPKLPHIIEHKPVLFWPEFHLCWSRRG